MHPAIPALSALSALGLSMSLASAATILGTSAAVIEGGTGDNFDMTALGTSDWVIWNSTSTGASAGTPTNSMSGGSLISGLSAVGGGAVRGSTTSYTAADFTFTNGTPTLSGSVSNAVGAFNDGLDTVGRGISLTIVLPTTGTYTVYIWGGAYEADQATLTVSLTGATSYVNSTLSASAASPKTTRLYTLTATPDTAGDLLNVRLVLTDDGSGSSSHALISGAAISIVPEPGSAMLVLLGAMGLAIRRRRHLLASCDPS